MLDWLGVGAFVVGVTLFAVAGLVWYLMAKWEFEQDFNVMCPETEQVCAVHVDAKLAARTRMAGHEDLRLTACSRWPEKQNCDQACTVQVPFLGDSRSKTKWAPFGLHPKDLRVEHPVKMTKELYEKVGKKAS